MKSHFFAIALLLLFTLSSCSTALPKYSNDLQSSDSTMLSSLNDVSFGVNDILTSSEELPVNLTTLIEVHFSLPTFVVETTSIDGRFLSLTIKNYATQELIQTITLDNHSPEYQPIRGNPNAITIVDVNFDGYNDLQILTGDNGNWRTGYIYFVWDSILNKFIADPYELYKLGLPNFDEKTQIIESMNRGNVIDHWFYEHRYINDKLILIKEISCVGAYPSIEALEKIKQSYPDKDLILFFTKKELNGETCELETVLEVYCFEVERIEGELTPTEIIPPDSEIGKLLYNS